MTAARFDFTPTSLTGLTLIQRKLAEDARGFFGRLFCAEEFKLTGLEKPIVQINHTFTKSKAAVRGLHFQRPPYTETKIVNCVRGGIFDVAVDLRKGSPTFLCWHAEVLSAQNRRSLIIPEGFAHGFQTLTDDCELIYFHTAPFCAEAEGAINVADPRLAISWPLAITELSERDKHHVFIGSDFEGIAP